jgi:creatinine amidohydrolase
MIKRDYQLKYMSWPEIKNKIDNGCDTVIIVLASTEQHGPHMAECTDEVIGLGFACGLAERLKNALVAPPIIPGLSEHHLALPGSLSLRKEIFRGIAKDYVDCYIRHGFKKFIFISSHGGNMEETKTIVEEMQASYPDKLFINTLSIEILLRIFTSFEKQYNMPVGSCGGHACAFETSVMLYLEPELVKMEKAKAGFVGIPDKKIVDKMFKYGVVGISEIGVLGDPTLATAELGEKFYNAVLDEMEKGLNVSQ